MKQKSSKAEQNILRNVTDKEDITHLFLFSILDSEQDYQTTF